MVQGFVFPREYEERQSYSFTAMKGVEKVVCEFGGRYDEGREVVFQSVYKPYNGFIRLCGL